MAARVQELETGGNKDLQDMRRSLSELEARVPLDSPLAERLSHYGTGHDEINALQERVDEVERHAAEVAERSPGLEEHIHTLAARIQALEASAVQDELDALRGSVDALADRPVADPTLPERVEQIGAQLDAVAAASSQVDDLRAQDDAFRFFFSWGTRSVTYCSATQAEKPESEQAAAADETDSWDNQDYEYFFGDYLDDGYQSRAPQEVKELAQSRTRCRHRRPCPRPSAVAALNPNRRGYSCRK